MFAKLNLLYDVWFRSNGIDNIQVTTDILFAKPSMTFSNLGYCLIGYFCYSSHYAEAGACYGTVLTSMREHCPHPPTTSCLSWFKLRWQSKEYKSRRDIAWLSHSILSPRNITICWPQITCLTEIMWVARTNFLFTFRLPSPTACRADSQCTSGM